MAKTARRKLRQISRSGALSAEERARRILDERTQALAARSGSGPSPSADVERVLICTIGREHYGIPIDAVAEVLPFQECLPLPEGPPALVGLFGRSGQLVSVVDLGRALGLAAPSEDGGRHLVLLRRSSPRIALRVDRAEGVETVTRIVHEENGGFRKEAVTGYAESSTDIADQERILSLLDLDRLLRPFLSSSASGA
ncbi:chemotaxis protein CheW [Microvirga rosea]|uniref:chemotaxis protein CheW n=1 Tax=Microvirga rosea TaxID=2715425 RepID=UPI001D0A5DD6|nr:chemotaxis protein CheW [Microvirga rosea]MCB8819638.1 chemotaxis protein CheW [Microvirga rosea]